MFWRGMMGYLPANIVQGVVGLAAIVAFTRILTPAQFGDYALGFAVMTLAHTSLFTWNEAAMARFWAGEAGRGASGNHSATIYRSWLVLLAGLPLLALAVWLWPASPQIKYAILAGLAAVAPRSVLKLVQERRRAAGEVTGAAALEIGQTLVGFAIGVALAQAGLGGAGPLLGLAIGAVLCLPFVYRSEQAKSLGGRFETDRARSHAAYGVPIALSMILALALATLDRFMLAGFLDQTAVGHYHAGYSLANRTLDVAFIWLGAAGTPALIAALDRGGPQALAERAREQVSVMVFLTLPAAIGLALVARPLAQLVIGAELSEGAARVTPWIAASGFFAGLTTYYLNVAFALGKRTTLMLAALAVPALANFLLNLVLIPRFGVMGAVWATLASYAFGAAVSWGLGRRVLRLPMPWGDFARTGVAAALMVPAVLQVPAWGGAAEVLVKAGVGAGVFALVAWLLDAGGVRGHLGQALRVMKARPA